MEWYDVDNVQYNRFTNLDGVEDKILFYLISEKDKNEKQKKMVHTLWRLLYYNDEYSLIEDEEHPLPKYKDIVKMINNNGIEQMKSRLFRYPFVEDTFTEQCSQIRVYVDNVIPVNHLMSNIGIAIEVIIHNKIANIINNIYNEEDEPNNPTELYPLVTYKSRLSVLLKTVLGLLNGADIAGVGKLQFNRSHNSYDQAILGTWNNKNFFGYKVILSCGMSGVE